MRGANDGRLDGAGSPLLVRLIAGAASAVLDGPVDPSDNFFQLGGDSVRAARLVARLKKSIEGLAIELDDVFEAPVIEDLATRIIARMTDHPDVAGPGSGASTTASVGDFASDIRQDGRGVSVPLTYAQCRRLQWDLEDGAQRKPHHITDVFDLQGPVNLEAFEAACLDIVRCHPALRTIFTCDESGRFHARRLDLDDLTCDRLLRVVQSSDLAEVELERLVEEEATSLFDLAAEVKLRVMLVTDGGTRHRMVITVEHLVCDGQSFAILLRDLSRAYMARCLEPHVVWRADPRVDAVWAEFEQRTYGATLSERLDYWRSNLDPLEVNPEIRLPGMCDPTTELPTEAWARTAIPARVIEDLRKACVAQSASLYCGVLSAVALSVLAHTGKSTVGVTSPTSIRPEGWQDHVDWIASSSIYRFRVESGDSTYAVIRAARATVINGIRHTLPLSLLLGQLMPRREDLHRWQPYLYLSVSTSADSYGFDLPGVRLSRVAFELSPPVRRSCTFLTVQLTSTINSVSIQYDDGTWSADNAQRFLDSLISAAELLAHDIPCSRAIQILRRRHTFV